MLVGLSVGLPNRSCPIARDCSAVYPALFSDEPILSENELEGYQWQQVGQRPDGEQHMVVYTLHQHQ